MTTEVSRLYERGQWAVYAQRYRGKYRGHFVSDTTDYYPKIQASDLEAAKRIVDCLAENGA